MLLQQADNNPLAVADYELRRNHLLATNIQANTFVEELKKRLGADIEIRIVNHISRGKQHISVTQKTRRKSIGFLKAYLLTSRKPGLGISFRTHVWSQWVI